MVGYILINSLVDGWCYLLSGGVGFYFYEDLIMNFMFDGIVVVLDCLFCFVMLFCVGLFGIMVGFFVLWIMCDYLVFDVVICVVIVSFVIIGMIVLYEFFILCVYLCLSVGLLW